MMGLWYPRLRCRPSSAARGAEVSADVRAPELVVEGRRAQRALDHDVEGRGDASGLPRSRSQGWSKPGIRRLDTRETRRDPPWAWRRFRSRPRRGSHHRHRWPRPRRARWPWDGCGSPPSSECRWLPVAAIHAGGSRKEAHARRPSMTAALSRYAESMPCGFGHGCCGSCRTAISPAARRRWSIALKILWRQCSEFAWANIISSASVGSRPRRAKPPAGNRSHRRRARNRSPGSACFERRAPARERPWCARRRGVMGEQALGLGGVDHDHFGHAIEQARGELPQGRAHQPLRHVRS